MKINLKHGPKPKLSDILSRRGQRLMDFMQDIGLPDFDAVLAYCSQNNLEAPAKPEITVAVHTPVQPSEPATFSGPPVELVEEKTIEADVSVPVVEKHLNRKQRRQKKELELGADDEKNQDPE